MKFPVSRRGRYTSSVSAGSLPHRPQSLRTHQGVVRFSGSYKFWAHRNRFQVALQVSSNRSSSGLTISEGTDWSKAHTYQYVHELGTRTHRPGSQRSTKGQTSHWKSKGFVRLAAVCGTTGIVSRISSPRAPHKKVKGRVLSPHLNCNSESVHRKWRGIFGVQWESIECPVRREAQ